MSVACIMVALCVDLALVQVGLDAQDEGYFVEQTTRVLQGQLPYRDFDTLYTPALLYLHSAVVSLFGGSQIVDLRLVGWLWRLVLAVGLYLLGRRWVRPAIAVLSPLWLLIALDQVPSTWEPHPGWPSAALTVLAVGATIRVPSTRGVRRHLLLAAIGGTAALVFALKQNAGVLLGLALLMGTAWHGLDPTRAEVTRGLRAIQIFLLGGVVVATAWLVHPHAAPVIVGYLMVPLVAAALPVILPVRVSDGGRGVRDWLRVLGWLTLGSTLVSAPWLVALLSALDWNVALIKGFVGVVNQDVLWYPPRGPDSGAWAGLLGVAVALLGMVRWRRRLLRGLLALTVLAFVTSMALLTHRPGEAIPLTLMLAPGRASEGLAMLLPIACMLGGAWLSLRMPPGRTTWWLRWMTVASAVTFLTEYPRVDEVHLTWSACLPLATGGLVLASLHADLSRRWRAAGASRYLLLAALLVVPVATSLRSVAIRGAGFIAVSNSAAFPVHRVSTIILTSPAPVAGLIVPRRQADTLLVAAQFVASNTAPAEPIFVYPTSPLVYVLADRPNPTRFAHLYPGAATPAEMDDLLASLRQIPVDLVVVNESDLAFWGPALGNASLEDYLAQNYHEIADFGPYRVLRRET